MRNKRIKSFKIFEKLIEFEHPINNIEDKRTLGNIIVDEINKIQYLTSRKYTHTGYGIRARFDMFKDNEKDFYRDVGLLNYNVYNGNVYLRLFGCRQRTFVNLENCLDYIKGEVKTYIAFHKMIDTDLTEYLKAMKDFGYNIGKEYINKNIDIYINSIPDRPGRYRYYRGASQAGETLYYIRFSPHKTDPKKIGISLKVYDDKTRYFAHGRNVETTKFKTIKNLFDCIMEDMYEDEIDIEF